MTEGKTELKEREREEGEEEEDGCGKDDINEDDYDDDKDNNDDAVADKKKIAYRATHVYTRCVKKGNLCLVSNKKKPTRLKFRENIKHF